MSALHLHRIAVSLSGLFIAVSAAGQGLQTGPEFLRGGEYLDQINRTDETYDPQEIAREFIWDYDVPEREGLVDVRFTVKADGTVSDVQVIDGFYHEEFREQAVAGIATSIFHVPMAGETAIDWPAYDMRIILRGPFMPAISPELAPEIEALITLVTERNFTEAETRAKALLADTARTLFDYALLQDQLASIYLGTERGHEALVAMRNATSDSKAVTSLNTTTRLGARSSEFPDEYLLPDLYRKALEKRFLVATALNQTGEALSTFALIEAGSDEAPAAALSAQAELIRAKLATEEPIGAQIKLVQGRWTYEVSTRRIFGFTGLQGQVDYVDIVCGDNRRRRMAFTNDSEFGLPASWEDCKLDFHGTDGSQFLLYEYLN